MNSMERVLKTLGHEEPDRVPWINLVTMHGARELGLDIESYFAQGAQVAQGQIQMQEEFGHDCYYSFFYAPIETEAMGGKVIYRLDGPPNAGPPILHDAVDIDKFKPPDPKSSPILERVFQANQLLSQHAQGTIPIIGVVMSPFSLPVMQMGFETYLEILWERGEAFWQLMEKNKRFCIDWANAQLASGANAICFFDPVSSGTIIPLEHYLETGYLIAKDTIAQIQGPTATHFASGSCRKLLGRLPETGTAIAGVSALEDLGELKEIAAGKISLLGNLNGITMMNWSEKEAETQVRQAIAKAGRGGGFLLGDNHGEIPIQVPKEVLQAMGKAIRKYGNYPLGAQ